MKKKILVLIQSYSNKPAGTFGELGTGPGPNQVLKDTLAYTNHGGVRAH